MSNGIFRRPFSSSSCSDKPSIDVAVRPSRLRNWSVCTTPTFTRRTASELTTVHRPKPLLPSSGLFQESSTLLILDTPRVCSVSLTTDRANLCSLLQEYHRIFSKGYQPRFFSCTSPEIGPTVRELSTWLYGASSSRS